MAVPFFLMLVVVLAGGALNTVEATGTTIDASTDQPVPNAGVSLGNRSTTSGADGAFDLGPAPRTAALKVQAPGYAPTTVPTEAGEVRLQPATFTLQVWEAKTTPPKGVRNPEVRLATKVVGTGGPTGSVVVVPYPAVGAQLLVCAPGFDVLGVEARGISKEVFMTRGDDECPPLASPTPVPTVGPSVTPSGPAPTPSPTP